ncbi:transcriptional regulator, XRE family with cupin sensor [Desulfacinum hydrothermale DSM 13146]|uniref:Transcriptional regulator, XRE family with cupin sensor n=1 Tax=Desulfacinum hydrothermale DSM 13146 TaxID=1121390 RepID=A0A1W1X3X3_9BACT|nr:cupin domain-containing protein [Desulfacinum hydrothermale]SMC18654.1 transcriptional regulator, XRE family with cupin sensor [Desulfacinum hydrothermale DSM 13146]
MQHTDDVSREVQALNLGAKVRDLRQKFRYTVQDLAAKTGLEKELLDQIEAEMVVPPVATLLKLAKAFNVGLAYFFQDELTGQKISITRKSERTRLERRPHHREGEVTYIYETLENKKPEKHMEPFLVEFPVMDTAEMVFVSHEGEEFLYLMEGRLEFRTVDRVEVLEPGDSIYFDSDISHSFRCIGDAPAKAVVVVWSRP